MRPIDALKEVMSAEEARVAHAPDHPWRERFEARTAPASESFRTAATRGAFELTIDEPSSFGGTGCGPNPLETLLAAVAAGVEITWRAHAAALGVPSCRVAVQASGWSDVRGFHGVGAAAGLNDIAIRIVVGEDLDPGPCGNYNSVSSSAAPCGTRSGRSESR